MFLITYRALFVLFVYILGVTTSSENNIEETHLEDSEEEEAKSKNIEECNVFTYIESFILKSKNYRREHLMFKDDISRCNKMIWPNGSGKPLIDWLMPSKSVDHHMHIDLLAEYDRAECCAWPWPLTQEEPVFKTIKVGNCDHYAGLIKARLNDDPNNPSFPNDSREKYLEWLHEFRVKEEFDSHASDLTLPVDDRAQMTRYLPYINSLDYWGYSALHHAVRHKNEKVVNSLMTYPEVDINLTHKGRSALWYAVKTGQPKLVKQLLSSSPKASVKLYARDDVFLDPTQRYYSAYELKSKYTLLQLAVFMDYYLSIYYLMVMGEANINVQNLQTKQVIPLFGYHGSSSAKLTVELSRKKPEGVTDELTEAWTRKIKIFENLKNIVDMTQRDRWINPIMRNTAGESLIAFVVKAIKPDPNFFWYLLPRLNEIPDEEIEEIIPPKFDLKRKCKECAFALAIWIKDGHMGRKCSGFIQSFVDDIHAKNKKDLDKKRKNNVIRQKPEILGNWIWPI